MCAACLHGTCKPQTKCSQRERVRTKRKRRKGCNDDNPGTHVTKDTWDQMESTSHKDTTPIGSVSPTRGFQHPHSKDANKMRNLRTHNNNVQGTTPRPRFLTMMGNLVAPNGLEKPSACLGTKQLQQTQKLQDKLVVIFGLKKKTSSLGLELNFKFTRRVTQ